MKVGHMRLRLWSEPYPSGYVSGFKKLEAHLRHRIIEWLKASRFNLYSNSQV